MAAAAMIRALRPVHGLVFCAVAVACAGKSATPGAPDPLQPPTADQITITSGVDAIRTGFFADFTVTATMSDRTTQTVTRDAAWTTSSAAVATVDANGRLTAVSNGTVTLNASFQGRTASRSVRVVFNYGGHWNGTFVARRCDETGIFAQSRYCQNLGAEPSPFGLEVTQSGANVDQISGSISLKGLVGPVTGRVTPEGRLELSGRYTAPATGGEMRVEISGWSTGADTNGMSGTFVETLAVVGADGTAVQTNEIVTAVKRPDVTRR